MRRVSITRAREESVVAKECAERTVRRHSCSNQELATMNGSLGFRLRSPGDRSRIKEIDLILLRQQACAAVCERDASAVVVTAPSPLRGRGQRPSISKLCWVRGSLRKNESGGPLTRRSLRGDSRCPLPSQVGLARLAHFKSAQRGT